MKKFKGHIGISRSGHGGMDGKIRIRLTDAKNHCGFVTVEIGYAEFTQALTGLGGVSCDIEAYLDAPVGKRLETREILVPQLTDTYKNDAEARARMALVPYETEGWQGQDNDMLNSHRWTTDENGNPCSNVHFRRYVEPESDARELQVEGEALPGA